MGTVSDGEDFMERYLLRSRRVAPGVYIHFRVIYDVKRMSEKVEALLKIPGIADIRSTGYLGYYAMKEGKPDALEVVIERLICDILDKVERL